MGGGARPPTYSSEAREAPSALASCFQNTNKYSCASEPPMAAGIWLQGMCCSWGCACVLGAVCADTWLGGQRAGLTCLSCSHCGAYPLAPIPGRGQNPAGSYSHSPETYPGTSLAAVGTGARVRRGTYRSVSMETHSLPHPLRRTGGVSAHNGTVLLVPGYRPLPPSRPHSSWDRGGPHGLHVSQLGLSVVLARSCLSHSASLSVHVSVHCCVQTFGARVCRCVHAGGVSGVSMHVCVRCA